MITCDEISEVEENIRILIDAALEVEHLLEGHGQPVEGCPRCLIHTTARTAGTAPAA